MVFSMHGNVNMQTFIDRPEQSIINSESVIINYPVEFYSMWAF